ncbi:MAG: hypothetical protein U1F43_28350 [Myxococcota bacterium]
MADKTLHGLTAAELERRVRAVAPNLLVLEEHLVRRAVREDRAITGVRTFVPHTHVYALPAATLARIASPEELGGPLPAAAEPGQPEAPEAWVLLLPRGDFEDLDASDPARVLVATWRRVFHGRMDEALGRLVARGTLDRARALEVVTRVGQLPMDEARSLLADEGLTSHGAGAIEELCELVALHSELRLFAPELLPRYFPSLVGRDDLPALFDTLVPAQAIFEATRLEGAPDPLAPPAPEAAPDEDDGVLPRWRLRSLLDAARRASIHGRSIDGAIAAWRARRIAARGSEDQALAERLESESRGARGPPVPGGGGAPPPARPPGAAHAPGPETNEWPAALEPLLARARWGMAGVEARLLHDLQKAVDDAEHPLWDIDLGRWLRGFGRAPLKRQEVVAQKVAVARHLHSAARRLVFARIAEPDRRRLNRLLSDVSHAIEQRVRNEVGLVLARGLLEAGLVPSSIPEVVAEHKIVGELCDVLLDKGFIAFPDLRDLVARNQLKLGDLASVREWLKGDQLLVLDRFCHAHLDAAYRRGEVYRRSLQRLSSLLFGTPFGRLLVRYLFLPFGGSFFLLEGLDHTVMPLIGLAVPGPKTSTVMMTDVGGPAMPLALPMPHEVHHHLHLFSPPLFTIIGFVLLGVLHSAAMRRAAEKAFSAIGRGLRFVFSDLPKVVRALPPVAALLRTRGWAFFRDHVWRPALFAALPTLIVVAIVADAQLWLWVGLPLMLLLSVYFATRPGRHFVELSRDWWVRAWYRLKQELLPGLFALIMGFFKAIIDRTEIVLYVVDRWLRYRRSQSRVGTVFKVAFGLVWSMVAYLVRLVVNLIAEPQLNPIKHFPVVTVSHKFFIPMTLTMHPVVGFVAQLALPGICGFLVWEFKESWRLYRSNRWPNLRPVLVGSHGETVIRLLRPGFHSGTVPALFKKLRRAERKGLTQEARRLAEDLHHVEEAVERFIARELEALLTQSGQFPEAAALDVEHVQLTPARIAVRIGCAPLSSTPLELAFEEQSRFLVAHVVVPGFVAQLDAARKTAFEAALLGLYKLAGIDLVREHIATLLPGRPPYDIGPRGLVVWPTDFASEVVYPLRLKQTLIQPEIVGPRPVTPPPAIRSADIAFKQRQVSWGLWTSAWQSGAATRALLDSVLGGRSLLDPTTPAAPVAVSAEAAPEPASAPVPAHAP